MNTKHRSRGRSRPDPRILERRQRYRGGLDLGWSRLHVVWEPRLYRWCPARNRRQLRSCAGCWPEARLDIRRPFGRVPSGSATDWVRAVWPGRKGHLPAISDLPTFQWSAAPESTATTVELSRPQRESAAPPLYGACGACQVGYASLFASELFLDRRIMATKAMTQTQLFRHLAESCQLSNKVARQCMETLAETALERDQK